jgi:hypothetical protein
MTENYPSPLDGLHIAREQAQRLVEERTEDVTRALHRMQEAVDTLEAYDRAITAVIACENKAAHPKPPKAPKAPKAPKTPKVPKVPKASEAPEGKHSIRKVHPPLVGLLPPLGGRIYDVLPEDGYPMVVTEIAERLGVARQPVSVSASQLARHYTDLVERLDEDTYRRVVKAGGAP